MSLEKDQSILDEDASVPTVLQTPSMTMMSPMTPAPLADPVPVWST